MICNFPFKKFEANKNICEVVKNPTKKKKFKEVLYLLIIEKVCKNFDKIFQVKKFQFWKKQNYISFFRIQFVSINLLRK